MCLYRHGSAVQAAAAPACRCDHPSGVAEPSHAAALTTTTNKKNDDPRRRAALTRLRATTTTGVTPVRRPLQRRRRCLPVHDRDAAPASTAARAAADRARQSVLRPL